MSINKKLSAEISEMFKEDQTLRKKQRRTWINLNKKSKDKREPEYKKTVAALNRELKTVDQKNTARMKKIIKQYGWPGKSIVGVKGSYRA